MATQAFRDWLVRHEEDIAAGINDLGNLRGEFEMAIGRTPGRVMYPLPVESDPLEDVPEVSGNAEGIE